MYKKATAAIATLAIAGGALGFVPAAGAQDGPSELADACGLLLEFNPAACEVPPDPTPTPESPWTVVGDFQICELDIWDFSNPCDDDDPPSEPPPHLGPGDFQICEIDPFTLTNPCDNGNDPGDDGDEPGDDGDNPGDDGDEPGDDGDEPGDDGDDEDTEDTGGPDPASPADPIDGDPNFTG